MEKVFEIASRISTPLALAGLIATAFFYVARQIISKKIFPKLTAGLSTRIIELIINRFFALSVVGLILGFLGFVVAIRQRVDKIEDLVRGLYSRTSFETIHGSDGGRVFIQQLGDDRKRVFLRLEHAPLARSIQCTSGGDIFLQNSGIAMLSPMGHFHNIAYSGEITGDASLNTLTFTVQYVRDLQDTKSISKVEFQGPKVLFDGIETHLDKIE